MLIDVTQTDTRPLPPYTVHPARPADDDWLTALADTEDRVSVYADSTGRRITLAHPGLIPPAALIMSEGMPAGPVEFIWKGDD